MQITLRFIWKILHLWQVLSCILDQIQQIFKRKHLVALKNVPHPWNLNILMIHISLDATNITINLQLLNAPWFIPI